MKLLMYFSLISATQTVAEDVPKMISVSTVYLQATIRPTHLSIPENSHLKGIPSDTKQKDERPKAWMYDWIEYKRDISKFTAISQHYIIKYKIQYQDESWSDVFLSIFGKAIPWLDYGVSYDTLCSGSINGVGSLVQKLLGISPHGCPVSAGDNRYTSGITFPLKMESFVLFETPPNHRLRILFHVRSGRGNNDELLFTGIFYLYALNRKVEYVYSR